MNQISALLTVNKMISFKMNKINKCAIFILRRSTYPPRSAPMNRVSATSQTKKTIDKYCTKSVFLILPLSLVGLSGVCIDPPCIPRPPPLAGREWSAASGAAFFTINTRSRGRFRENSIPAEA